MLLSPYRSVDTAAAAVAAGLRPEHFFRQDWQPVVDVCIGLLAEGVTPTSLLVHERLTPNQQAAVRGIAGLESFVDGTPVYRPDQIAEMVRELIQKAWRREQIERVDAYRDRLYDEQVDSDLLQGEPTAWEQHAVRERYRPLLNDISILETPDTPFVIRDLFPSNALAMIAGPSTVGKSHFAISAAVATCLGAVPWFGRYEVETPGQVLYVAREGAGGLKKRVIAAKQAVDCPLDFPLGLHIHIDGFSLQSDADVSGLLRRLPRGADLRLVFLDTWGKLILPGDENNQRDAGIAIAAMDKIRMETGATVVALHHLNATGDRERGSTALKAGVDTAIRILPKMAGLREVTCDKQRDAASFDTFHFTLATVGPSVVPMWASAADEPVETTVDDIALAKARRLVQMRPSSSQNELAKEIGGNRQRALDAIRTAKREIGGGL